MENKNDIMNNEKIKEISELIEKVNRFIYFIMTISKLFRRSLPIWKIETKTRIGLLKN